MKPTEKFKVLLVDDRRENLLALESSLKNPEIEFYRAADGISALELLLDHDFNLAIVDVQMPGMDGFELAELMRGTEKTKNVSIIFVTAGVQDRINTFRGYEKGAVDFLYKPLDPQIVKSKVQVFLELSRQRHLIESQLKDTQEALVQRNLALSEADAALQARDEFLSVASHELRTPLTSLQLQLNLAQRNVKSGLTKTEEAVAKEVLQKILSSLQACERQSLRLGALLEELMDLTRLRIGRLELNKSEFDLVVLVKDVVGRFKQEADQKGVEIRLESDANLVGYWDPIRFEQVLSNLLSNAMKYGNRKPIEVVLDKVPEKTSVRLCVRDHGMGIPEDMQSRIFRRFERAVSPHHISGLGLGLYITHQIVTAHGGSISVESALGNGSSFMVEVPFKDDRTETFQEAASRSSGNSKNYLLH